MPYHSTFSKNRIGRFCECEAYRWLSEEIVEQCRVAGLVGGEGFAVDGTLVAADAARDQRVEAVEAIRKGDSTRPVREYLEAHDTNNPVHQGDAR